MWVGPGTVGVIVTQNVNRVFRSYGEATAGSSRRWYGGRVQWQINKSAIVRSVYQAKAMARSRDSVLAGCSHTRDSLIRVPGDHGCIHAKTRTYVGGTPVIFEPETSVSVHIFAIVR